MILAAISDTRLRFDVLSCSAAVFFASVLVCTPVLAQLTPPIARNSTDVPYPAAAEGDASVLLELFVEADGTVSHAEVIEGHEPFAEQARRAVLTWVFTPAQRDDTPVAARIRARVDFHQQRRPTVAPVAEQPASQPTPLLEAPLETPLEVTIRGERHDVGKTTLSASDIREMPGAFGDPFRAIEALPSVTPILSGIPYYYVRGAPPNDNGYYVDGVRVPLLFHVGLGQGVIHPALIDRVDMFAGAPPASYGGAAGAIISGQIREPATTLHGAANLRLVDAGALIEVPFDRARGSVLAAGRYGYPGLILRAITPDVDLDYWDYQARATWRPSDRDTLGVFAFGSHDYFASGTPLDEQFASDFHRVDLRYDHAFADGRLRFAVTGGYDSRGAAPSYLSDKLAAVRLEVDQKLSATMRFRAGAAASVDAYGFKQDLTGVDEREPVFPSTVDPPPTNLTGGVHADLVWHVTPQVEIVPGARLDVYSSTRGKSSPKLTTTVPAFDPRLAVRVTIAPSVVSLSTVGLSHQYPTLQIGSVPALIASGSGFPLGEKQLQTVLQASQGVELTLPADIVVTTTGFFSAWSGLTDLTATCEEVMPAIVIVDMDVGPPPRRYHCPGNQPVTARAFGFELLARRSLSKRVTGWLSYTLARSTRRAHFLTLDGTDAVETVPSEFDRTHVLSAILALDIGAGWHIGGRFVLYTGTPYSALSGSIPIPPYNSRRTPAFKRLDVRFEKRWMLSENASIALVLEGLNVTLSKEVTGLGLSCQGEMTPTRGTTQCELAKLGPITLPSLGVDATF